VGCFLLVVLLALRVPVAAVFTDDGRVSVATTRLLVWLALVQPLSGAAFTLDGILMGASDTRYLAKAMIACSVLFVAVALLALNLGWGTAGLAAGATAWLGARTASLGVRLRSERWTLQG
jgi:Na+-driven multidrug efflux pump